MEHPTLGEVLEHAPDDAQVGPHRRALRLLEEKGRPFTPADVRLQAGRLTAATSKPAEETRPSGRLKVSETSRVESQRLIAALTPSVEHVRRECFGTTAPPFAWREKAIHWLEQTSKQELQAWQHAQAEHQQPTARPASQAGWFVQQLQQGLYREYPDLQWNHLTYRASGSSRRRTSVRVPQTDQGVLPRLYEGANALFVASGFDEPSIVDWILTGALPVLTPAYVKHVRNRWTLPDGTIYVSERVNILIQVPHVTEREFRELYALTRAAWRRTDRTRITAFDRRLLDAIRRHGPPTRPRAEQGYWRRIARATRRPEESARIAWHQLKNRHPELVASVLHHAP